MTCDEVRRSIPLIQYSEISFDDEEAVHSHVAVCAGCRAEWGRERSLHALLDERELGVSPFLLRRSRDELMKAIAAEQSRRSWWSDVASAFSHLSLVPAFAKPMGAVALIALGFFGARVIPIGSQSGMNSASLIDPANARVRYVEPGPQGEVQLVVDETRQRVVSGRVDDSSIRNLLLAAAKDPSDPGLRVESVNILKSRSEEDVVRTALVYALEHDPNAGVRLKALEGLKPYAGQPEVRKALSQVLLTDENPGLRAQAIDLLTQNAIEDQVVGVLQESMHKEENGYVRLRCEKALRRMKASVETY